jgi:ribonuclease BN (tRNA processing enzyme)
VEHVNAGEFLVGEFTVRSMRLRHPGTTLGYRLTPTAGGASLAYVTDNELGPGGHYATGERWRQELIAFLRGVDVLIHDAMYTPEELKAHAGWGHSSYSEAVALAAEAGVQRLVLFHHEPEHDDGALDELVVAAKKEAKKLGATAEVLAAQEGLKLTL